MSVTFDKLLRKPLLHTHKSSDIDYTDGIILTDSDNVQWTLTVNTDGALVTALTSPPITTGNPIGLLLVLTYS